MLAFFLNYFTVQQLSIIASDIKNTSKEKSLKESNKNRHIKAQVGVIKFVKTIR